MQPDPFQESVRHLSALGFTELEAAVYTFLVESSPATAYRVAQGIGKPVANTYKAVESLQQKGAVLVDETGTRLCRAVPPAELLASLEKAFDTRREAAAQSLGRLRPAKSDDGVFTLTSAAQVYDHCGRMLERAGEVVLLDAFPAVIERLRPALEGAAARGLTVVVQAYSPTSLNGVDVVVPRAAGTILERWPGQWLCLLVDGAEYLFAFLDRSGDKVHQAIWSASSFISWVQHSYLSDSLRANLLEGLLDDGASPEDIEEARARAERWTAREARGYRELRGRFDPSGE
jgi:HTH-type transcriptional regulator, sugar sensing transcriptional regulator